MQTFRTPTSPASPKSEIGLLNKLAVSLFPGETPSPGSGILFRAVCAVGWALYARLPELRSICDEEENSAYPWLHWIDVIEGLIPVTFTSHDVTSWPDHVARRLRNHALEPDIVRLPGIAAFLLALADDIALPASLDPVAQIDFFNESGWKLAAQLIHDSRWSVPAVQNAWQASQSHPWRFRSDTAGSFQPVTVPSRNALEIRVNTTDFALTNSLIYYLTLEFQMMHEYISHVLPVWNSGNTLEEEYLLAVMFLWYRSERKPLDGIHALLVRDADERRKDPHRDRRVAIWEGLALLTGQERLTQLLLELAVMDEKTLSRALKRRLLSLLNRLPVNDADLQRSITAWLLRDDVATILGRLDRVFPAAI